MVCGLIERTKKMGGYQTIFYSFLYLKKDEVGIRRQSNITTNQQQLHTSSIKFAKTSKHGFSRQ